MNNKRIGNEFEKDTAEFFRRQNYWVYRIPDKINGQPFDIIAAGHGTVYVIDCKVCCNDVFDKNRIEENQISSMKMFLKANPDFWAGFMFKFADSSVVFAPFTAVTESQSGSIKKQEIIEMGVKADYENSCWC